MYACKLPRARGSNACKSGHSHTYRTAPYILQVLYFARFQYNYYGVFAGITVLRDPSTVMEMCELVRFFGGLCDCSSCWSYCSTTHASLLNGLAPLQRLRAWVCPLCVFDSDCACKQLCCSAPTKAREAVWCQLALPHKTHRLSLSIHSFTAMKSKNHLIWKAKTLQGLEKFHLFSVLDFVRSPDDNLITCKTTSISTVYSIHCFIA